MLIPAQVGIDYDVRHLSELTGYGVVYRSFTELYLDSTGAFKDAVIGILAAAKQERVRLSERTKAGLERARLKVRSVAVPRLRMPIISW